MLSRQMTKVIDTIKTAFDSGKVYSLFSQYTETPCTLEPRLIYLGFDPSSSNTYSHLINPSPTNLNLRSLKLYAQNIFQL